MWINATLAHRAGSATQLSVLTVENCGTPEVDVSYHVTSGSTPGCLPKRNASRPKQHAALTSQLSIWGQCQCLVHHAGNHTQPQKQGRAGQPR